MKTRLLSILTLAALTCASFAQNGQLGPYSYAYSGTPVSAPTTAINPPPGSTVIDTSTGTRYRKISAIGDNTGYAVESSQVVSAYAPVTTDTITAGTTQANEFVYAVPAGTIAALTFTFPSDANSRLGQEITLLSTQIVTTLTVSSSGLTILGTAVTALTANVPVRWIKTAASTWVRTADVATNTGVTLTTPAIVTGLTASGSASNDFSASTGTFKTSSGANQLTGAVTIADATTPSLTTAAGKTNSGFIQVNGKTSGALKFLPVDASAQTVTVSLAAQTVGAATLTIPDQAGVASSVSSCSTATLTAGATPAFTPKSNISTYLLTPGEAETIAGTTTGAVAGKMYHVRILTSGTSAYVITFGANFKSTGTLSTGTADAKTFTVSFLYDGTNFCEVARTTAM